MYTAQITDAFNLASKFIADHGLFAFLVLVVVIVICFVIGGLVYAILQSFKLLGKMQDNSATRDTRLDELDKGQDRLKDSQEKVADALEKISPAFDRLTEMVNGHTEVTRATVTSYQTLEEKFVQSYDATSIAIGTSSKDVKENSNKNTEKIIKAVDDIKFTVANELKEPLDKVESAVSGLTEMIKSQVMSLEARAINAERTAAQLELRISQLQAVNAGASTDPDHTVPLSEFKLPNSPSAAEDNRKELDDTHQRMEAEQRAKLVEAASGDKPEPPLPPILAVNPDTGDIEKKDAA